jgi:hypothetical protein
MKGRMETVKPRETIPGPEPLTHVWGGST